MVASTKAFQVYPTEGALIYFRMVDSFDQAHADGVARAMSDIGRRSEREMFRRHATGRRSGIHWPSLPRRSSAEGEFPARQSGRMAKNIGHSRRGIRELEVGVRRLNGHAPYPKFLEYGTRKIARRPFIEPISNQFGQEMALALFRFSRISLSRRLQQRHW